LQRTRSEGDNDRDLNWPRSYSSGNSDVNKDISAARYFFGLGLKGERPATLTHQRGFLMKHSSRLLHFFLSAALGLACPSTVWAVVPLTAPPIPKRVALADLVLVGKVTAVEDNLVDASPLMKIPGVSTKVSYRVAVVTLDAALLGGKKDQTKIRVGVFQPAKKPGEDRPARSPKVQFALDQEGCFFLRKHPDEAFYVVQEPRDFLDKAKTKDYDKELALANKCAQLLANPDAALEAKEGDDRLLAAGMLIFRCRTPLVVYTREPKTEAIGAALSKRILTVLAEADWTEKTLPSAMAPVSLFLYMGLTEKDGWHAPENVKALPDAARAWLRKNATEFRIQRYVAEEANKK
jgi:hypothetical protein